MKTWIIKKEEGILLKLYIQPGASKNSFAGEFGEDSRLKIRIKSPPVDGAASKELIKFLSKELKLAKGLIFILRGDTSRNKDIYLEISGHEQSEIVRIISNLT